MEVCIFFEMAKARGTNKTNPTSKNNGSPDQQRGEKDRPWNKFFASKGNQPGGKALGTPGKYKHPAKHRAQTNNDTDEAQDVPEPFFKMFDHLNRWKTASQSEKD
jgi:hypothetical protein